MDVLEFLECLDKTQKIRIIKQDVCIFDGEVGLVEKEKLQALKIIHKSIVINQEGVLHIFVE